jgi:hypothetical protein
MRQIDFEILTWLAPSDGHKAARATLASLRIHAGLGRDPLTEVEDTIARTVRTHINVAGAPLAVWLLANWWRLRWEPDTQSASLSWQQAHSMAAIGEGYAWPALEFASDGEFIQLRLAQENAPDACAVRYLREMLLDVPAADFEAAVDAFVDQVDGRLAEVAPGERTLADLRAELLEERIDPALAEQCRRQALAGIDAGQASDEWLRAAADLAALAGAKASEEVMAAALRSEHALESARETVEEIRASTTTVNLAWAVQGPPASSPAELPWERGARLARELRVRMGLSQGPLSNARLGELLNVHLPLTAAGKRPFSGGFANGGGLANTAVTVASRRVDNQRFALARLVGWVRAAPAGGHLLPVTDAGTALQKLQRSFAQEFLCPFEALDAFTEEHGLDDDGIEDAAEYFGVSQRLILSTLVNKKKLPRNRLSAL